MGFSPMMIWTYFACRVTPLILIGQGMYRGPMLRWNPGGAFRRQLTGAPWVLPTCMVAQYMLVPLVVWA